MAENPTYSETVRRDLFVEPLGGPISPARLLDTFPDELYDKSPSSHLYQLVYALLGPSGVGEIVKNYFKARLEFLENGIELYDIEKFYGDPFAFGRILEERISMDVESLLSAEDWEKIKSQDASYRSRSLEFFNAVRLGTSPSGVRYAARSGLGHDVEVFERYKWIFDNLSDQPLGIKSWGHTYSVNEFTVVPRKEAGRLEVQRIKFEASTESGDYVLAYRNNSTVALDHDTTAYHVQEALRSLPHIGSSGVVVTGGPAPMPFMVTFRGPLANEDVPKIDITSYLLDQYNRELTAEVVTDTIGVSPIDEISRIPDRLVHNMQSAIDRLRPVNSLPTVNMAHGRVLHRPWNSVSESSTYKEVVRYVIGSDNVHWPEQRNVDNKFWIRKGIEKPGIRKHGDSTAHYVNFHHIEKAIAYTDEALDQPDYEDAQPYAGERPEEGSPDPDRRFINFLSEPKFKVVGGESKPNPDAKNWLPENMVHPNPDDRSISDGMVQGIYPAEYLSLPGVDAGVPSNLHWKSLIRFAPSVDVIEVDLGEAMPVNLVTFDVHRYTPLKMYVDLDTMDAHPRRQFEPVVPITDNSYQEIVSDSTGPMWKPVSFRFEDALGNIPITRILRIRLERQPISGGTTIEVRSLKVGRSVVS